MMMRRRRIFRICICFDYGMVMIAGHHGNTGVHAPGRSGVTKQHRGGRQALRRQGNEQQPEDYRFDSAAHWMRTIAREQDEVILRSFMSGCRTRHVAGEGVPRAAGKSFSLPV
jgi:hypothetical protein